MLVEFFAAMYKKFLSYDVKQGNFLADKKARRKTRRFAICKKRRIGDDPQDEPAIYELLAQKLFINQVAK